MTARTKAALAALAALALAVSAVACAGGEGGEGGDTGTESASARAPDGSGYFVGTTPEGLGAALDLKGDDAVVRAVAAARAGSPPALSVGIVALVNRGEDPQPLPRFIAVFEDGGAVPLPPAHLAGGRLGAAARRVPAPPILVPAGGSVTTYVVLAGAGPAEVDHVRMVVRPGEPARLEARPR